MFDKTEHHHNQDGIIVSARTAAVSTTGTKEQIQNGSNDIIDNSKSSGSGSDNENENENTEIKTKIALSTRFSLEQTSHSSATWFTKLFKQHGYIQSGFRVHAPNAFNKETCDPNWTDFDWTCRGTRDSCQHKNVLADRTTRPTNDCCWRYSFRFQLEEANATGGFMLQLVEKGDEEYQEFGKGQKIERDMAHDLKLKIFRVDQLMGMDVNTP